MFSRSLKQSLLVAIMLAGADSAFAAWDRGELPDRSSDARVMAPDGRSGLDFPAGEQLAALTPDERQRLKEQIRDQWQNKSPEERERMKEEFRQRRQELPPEQRQERREALRERFQQMPPEDRRAFREELRQRRSEGGERDFERHGGRNEGDRPQRPGLFRR